MSEDFAGRYLASGVVAIMRATSSDQLLRAAEAVLAGGVAAIEVTMTTPGSLDVIEQAVGRLGSEAAFGAGTVLDAESARAAILAGAQFIVAPGIDLATIELCRRYAVPIMPGAFTATEILSCWQAGADYVKVFPAGVGGPGLIKALKAPLPQVRMIPVGGVTLDNTADFVRAGAVAVGVGNELVNQALLDDQDMRQITERAVRFREQVAIGRQG
ncbi:MAG: bifunctional 4-hydroxy-2-oxoglutarate aldolase/2-dehydro-3-deoxy-phosphogluconate aldolase [Propionicimonas sp.]|jgi:2-dehydro-3-deoxyphosphogluconate aldolase/(4S)-4-hydroxy-2-oxoglutarate aldolase